MQLKQKLMVGGAAALASVALFAGPAFANDCANLSRATNDAPGTAKGNWVELGEDGGAIWAFAVPGGEYSPPRGDGEQHGNYRNGTYDDLLGGSHACVFEGTGAGGAHRFVGQTQGTYDDSMLKGVWSACGEE